MNISELILKLEKIKEEEGDLVVRSVPQSCHNCGLTEQIKIRVELPYLSHEDKTLVIEGD